MKKVSNERIKDYIYSMDMDEHDRLNYEITEEEIHNIWICDLADRLDKGLATQEDMLDIIQYSNDVSKRLNHNARIKSLLEALKEKK